METFTPYNQILSLYMSNMKLLAGRQARVRFSARHHREVFPTEHKCNEEMERGLGEWRWMNVWYHCMNVIRNACIEKDKINKKCGNRHQTFRNFIFDTDQAQINRVLYLGNGGRVGGSQQNKTTEKEYLGIFHYYFPSAERDQWQA